MGGCLCTKVFILSDPRLMRCHCVFTLQILLNLLYNFIQPPTFVCNTWVALNSELYKMLVVYVTCCVIYIRMF